MLEFLLALLFLPLVAVAVVVWYLIEGILILLLLSVTAVWCLLFGDE